jgi:hypothetical protein
MSANLSFWRALHSLTHPVSIAAVALLLLNDHWLRHQHPSWLTGAGRFRLAGLAPFISALFFALIVPRRVRDHERIVGVVSFAAIGLWFVLAKTVPSPPTDQRYVERRRRLEVRWA